MRFAFKPFASVLFAFSSLSLFGVASPSWALTRAGTSIDNRAMAAYTDVETGFSSVLMSNTVSAEVQPLEAAVLTPNQSVQVPVGAPINLPHRLTNSGNTLSQFKLSVSNAGGDDFDITGLRIFKDVNDNGIPDAGEPEVTGQNVALEVGESISLVIGGLVPGNAAANTTAKLQLVAKSAVQGATATNTDSITATSSISVQVTESASVPQAKAGDTVVFTVTTTNPGNVSPLLVPITVDGAARQFILLGDDIPVNTSFSSFQSTGGGIALYHRVGDPKYTFLSRPPQNLDDVDVVASGFPSFKPQSTLRIAFAVRLHDNINADIRDKAELMFEESGNQPPETQESNEVRVRVPSSAPAIRFHRNEKFNEVAPNTSTNVPLYLEVNSASSNQDPTNIERINVTVDSLKTRDKLRLEAVETSRNSGTFRVITEPTEKKETKEDDTNVETLAGDILTGSFALAGNTVTTTIMVEPQGIVFDSRTNVPIPGARVTLIDVTGKGNGGHPGQEAVVHDFEDKIAPATVTTGANGEFQFPQVDDSTYRLQVVAPGHTFPSKVPDALLPNNRMVETPDSYGGNFTVDENGIIQIDVPVDPQVNQSGLFLEKTAARTQIEMGQFVDYELHLKNSTTGALQNIVLSDVLPVGFKFQTGTAHLGTATIIPTNPSSGNLNFSVGSLAVGAELRLTYRVLVGIGTKLGKNVNRATAAASNASSNQASATVNVIGGAFDDKGFIVGRVWVDVNKDGQIQPDEPGIASVRVWMEDGTFVLTDEDGKYSIYGLEARTHVVKVDVTTLPVGSQFAALSDRYGKGGTSYVIDLKKGELHKVNFAERISSPELLSEVSNRRKLATQTLSEAAQSLSTTLTPDGTLLSPGDVRGLPSSGFVGNASQNRFDTNPGENGGTGLNPRLNAQKLNSANSNLPTVPVLPPVPSSKVAVPELKDTLTSLSPELGFIGLKDGDTLALAQTNVRVKGGTGSIFKLSVNGVEVPDTRIGTKTGTSNPTVEAWEYVGLALKPGPNTLRLQQTDSFGIERGKIEISVIAPGDLGRLEITTPTTNPFADGRSLVKVSVRLSDARGATVSTRTAISLEASSGQWQVTDLNPTEPGAQVFIEGGRADFTLLAPAQPGDCDIRISSGVLVGNARLSFVPELRPLFVSGLATGKLNLFGFKARGANTIRTEDIFEDEDHARGALFVKGRVLGSSLLTLRYDSQKREDDRLFRDIQPDAYYPIYGDSGSRGFDAQSTGKLYVRVDREKSYVLYGDYTTSSLNQARSLGDYNRSLTGLKTHFEKSRFSANVFAARDNSRQVVEELRGNGTSGRYLLSSGDIRDQSEKIEIIVRDRNQPSVVLQTTPQTRFVDYTLDYFSQAIVFRSPVPSVDANLNPIFIRVSYEVEQDGPKFTVAGADAQFRVAKNFEVGGAYSRDQNPLQPFNLRSLNATVRFAPNTTLVGEWAQSSGSDLDGIGQRGGAQRIEFLHEGRKLSARLFWGRSDQGFNNPAALLSQGREEATLKATYKLDGSNRVVAEAVHSNDLASGGTRNGAQLALQHSFPNNVQLEVGVRKVKDSGALQTGTTPGQLADFTSVRAKVSAPLPGVPRANVSAEYERAIQGDGQVLALGGDYQIAARTRIYARHEFLSSLNGRYGLNDVTDQQNTVLGIESDYTKNGRAFSEYRIGGGIDGRDAQASIGLRNNWNLGEGLRANTTFERIRSLGGTSLYAGDNSTAITGALEYTRSPNFKGTARLEVRNGSRSDSILGTLGAAYKISPSLSLLGKGVLSRTSGGSTGVDLSNQNQSRALLGLSYRPTNNDRLQALLKYELRRNTGALATRLRRNAQIVSANVNYQASRKWALSGHYALVSGSDLSNNLSNRSTLQAFSARALYNIGPRTDFSFLLGASRGGGVTQTGVGAEFGIKLTSQLRLGIGYLLGRFNDGDTLTDLGLSDSGFYLRFGYEFDESAFGGLSK